MSKLGQYGVALGALFLIAPASIAISPVSFSLQTLVLLTIGGLFRPQVSLLITALYILSGMLGLPVFSGYTGGYEKLLGATGGFFLGFFVAPPLLGLAMERIKLGYLSYVVLFLLAHVVILIPGFSWLAVKAPGVNLAEVFLSLLPGLFIKSIAGAGIVSGLRKYGV